MTTVKISKRKRAEEALQESEERFRSVFEFAPIGTATEIASPGAIGRSRTLRTIL